MFSTIYDNWDEGSKECAADTTAVTFKQVAYWLEDDMNDFEDIADDANHIDYTQLTHLIFGYLAVNGNGSFNVNSNGTLADITDNNNFKDIIAAIQSNGVKVAISIGGGDSTNLQIIAADADLTDDFVKNVVDLVDEYGLDGVDLSWQFPDDEDEGKLFEDLVKALSSELQDQGVLFSIEVVSGLDEELANVIPSEVFDEVDFVNVRAFATDDYADLQLTTDDLLDVISYWKDRCLIQNKLVVGIPAYGTGANDRSYSYAEIIAAKSDKSTNACDSDDRVSIDGNYYYFNAIPTVIEKTAYG
ncbi:MAG: glycoside hydrolase family 18 protein, partial [Psychromonas sp.]|nr:glycoside hydrolase family 18 protein [Psychromonas sp.]